ncbi:MAG: hypothetical protein HKN32_08440, partial [Flavobacteriales bacterium]|nr:hypothetical protein [Flavobacteriales bacterium]
MKKRLFTSAVLGGLLLFFTGCTKEQGCTDPLATNFNASAEEDDGSCEYPILNETSFSNSFAENGNDVVDPQVSASNLVPAASLSNGMAMADSWFEDVDYRGAFGSTDWTAGWTLFSGYQPTSGADVVNISGTVAGDGETVEWTANNTYILDGFCFVNDGGTLNIEAGTVIKGTSGQGEDATALIIARGGTINAEGTATEPIVFTYENDPLDG